MTGGLLRLVTVTGEHVRLLDLFQGSWIEAVLLKLLRIAVSVSVMHDQCRKYIVTCTCTSGEREDRASHSIDMDMPYRSRVNASIEHEYHATLP